MREESEDELSFSLWRHVRDDTFGFVHREASIRIKKRRERSEYARIRTSRVGRVWITTDTGERRDERVAPIV